MSTTIEQLEETIRHLSPDELADVRAWYAEFDAEEWDGQWETDVASGRLDWLVEEAKQDRQAGRCTDR